ncbi:MAG: CopD family protein [Pseudohongiellaceae bacterium]
MPELSGWEAAGLVSRLTFYLALIFTVGGTYAQWLIADSSRRFRQRNLLYTLLGTVLGFHAVAVYFLVQVGGVNQSGMSGMFDWSLISFYLQLPVGDATVLRLSGFLLLLAGQLAALVHISRLDRPPRHRFDNTLVIYNTAGLALVIFSLRMTGHMATQPLASQLGLILHVSAMSLWLGALFPLWMMTREFGSESLHTGLLRFSRIAVVIVAILIAAGGVMVWQLFASLDQVFTSPYGRALLIKLLLVLLLLSLAGLNKWYLSPKVLQSGGAVKLRRSIGGEMLAGLLILVVTAWLSTVTGPGEH